MRYLFLFLLSWSAVVMAAAPQVLRLKHRPARQLMPLIRPFLAPKGQLAGEGQTLIINTTKENLAQIRELLKEIDTPPVRLLVSMRWGEAAQTTTTTREYDTDTPRIQRLETTADRPIVLLKGQQVPWVAAYAGDETDKQAEFGKQKQFERIEINPHQAGRRFYLKVSYKRQLPSDEDGGALDLQEVTHTINVELGKWSALLDASGEAQDNQVGQRVRTTTSSDDERIYVKVERLP